jgi:hypothetical protein
MLAFWPRGSFVFFLVSLRNKARDAPLPLAECRIGTIRCLQPAPFPRENLLLASLDSDDFREVGVLVLASVFV